jgi:hypothetical protein
LERVLVAMTADAGRRLSSVDLLDEGEHARLDEIGNRAVLSKPAITRVSIPVLWAARVARAPGAVALVCEGGSWTYREVEEAASVGGVPFGPEQGHGPVARQRLGPGRDDQREESETMALHRRAVERRRPVEQ